MRRHFSSCRSPRARASGRRAQHGVALIEALVSLLIFSVGVLGLMGLEARAINFSVDAEDRNRAALLANEIASNMWLAGSVSAVTAASWQPIVSNQSAGGLPNGIVSINTPAGGNANAADISISWKPPSDSATTQTSVLTTRVTMP